MSFEVSRDFLLWCTVINFGILLFWFVMLSVAHGFVYKLHTRWFEMSREQFDAIHYAGMAFYKLGIILFNLVPLIALLIMG